MESYRNIMALLQVVIDTASALTVLYVAVVVTANYGWRSSRERLKLVHRICLVLVSVAFGYHAEDIIVNFDRHGLTPSNVFLHLSLVSCIVISAVRMARLHSFSQAEKKPYTNGGAITGPFDFHH